MHFEVRAIYTLARQGPNLPLPPIQGRTPYSNRPPGPVSRLAFAVEVDKVAGIHFAVKLKREAAGGGALE